MNGYGVSQSRLMSKPTISISNICRRQFGEQTANLDGQHKAMMTEMKKTLKCW